MLAFLIALGIWALVTWTLVQQADLPQRMREGADQGTTGVVIFVATLGILALYSYVAWWVIAQLVDIVL